jgi:hypothetical protein
MSDWLMRVIRAEAKQLIELAADDDELRAGLRELAESILAATDAPRGEAKTASEAGASAAMVPVRPMAEGPPPAPGHVDEPLRELTLGRALPAKPELHPVLPPGDHSKRRNQELADIEKRCRLKSEAAHWAAERLRRDREGNEVPLEAPPLDPEMVAWGSQLVTSFYWIQAADGAPSVDVALVDHVGGCFAAAAEALALVRIMLDEHPGNSKVLERSLPLVAEAQSALRAAVQRLGGTVDPDQLEIFEWLKTTAARHHVFIKRFMRADEVAEPARWSELLARIESAGSGSKQGRPPDSQVERLRDLVKAVQVGVDNDENWHALINVVDDVIGAGVPPSNRELRDLLLPVIDEVPARDEYPESFRRVLHEIDRFLATRDATARSSLSHEPSAEVRETARLLGSKSIVLIGGNRRREAQESLKRALMLKDLIWIETKEHQAVDTFEPLIAREDVALVLLAIRWSSHAFGDVKQLCDRHGKLLVRLPGGYNPNQVAAQILSQSSGQLSSELGREAARARPPAQPERGPEPE